MFIRRVVIRNIRSIEGLEWTLPADVVAGWNVILGENGSGKSSFLRSVALALIGPKEAVAARQDWNSWLRSGKDFGTIQIQAKRDPRHDFFSGKGRTWDALEVAAAITITRNGDSAELSKRKASV